MEKTIIIGLDLAKNVFQAHGARADGSVAFRKKLTRNQVLPFFAEQPVCLVAMEACASAHHWARSIRDLGPEVRLIPPIYVKPFVKRQKNDSADAEAIAEEASRPTMRFVAVKGIEQQAAGMAFRTRDLFIRQKTQTINALRGHPPCRQKGPKWQSFTLPAARLSRHFRGKLLHCRSQMGYIRSKARDCHSRTSSSTAFVTRLMRSGET